MALSDEIIDDYIKNNNIFDADWFPLHTQAVERTIKLLIEASREVCTAEANKGEKSNLKILKELTVKCQRNLKSSVKCSKILHTRM